MSWAVGKDLGFSPRELLEDVEQVHDLKVFGGTPLCPCEG